VGIYSSDRAYSIPIIFLLLVDMKEDSAVVA